MSQELYKRYRPKTLDEVIGQEKAVSALGGLLKNKKVPHAIMFEGHTGCGKTTLARIMAKNLKCSKADFEEINCGDKNGIADVRKLSGNMDRYPMNGPVRVYLLDEAQTLSGEAQTGLLKPLEDTPDHVYFMICTTDPNKLKPTVRGRCMRIQIKPMADTDLTELVWGVAKKEKIKPEVSKKVIDRIVQCAGGSGRQALVTLEQIMGLTKEQERLAAILSEDAEAVAFDLVKLIMPFRGKVVWPEVRVLLTKIKDEDPEGMRRLILKVATTNLLAGDKLSSRAFLVIQAFRDSFFECGRAGLVAACWEVCTTKE